MGRSASLLAPPRTNTGLMHTNAAEGVDVPDAANGATSDGAGRLVRLLAVTARAVLADPVGARPARRVVAAIVRALPNTDASVFLKARGPSPLTVIAVAGVDRAAGPSAESDSVANLLTVAFAHRRPVLAGPDGKAALPRRWQEAGVRWAVAAPLKPGRHTLGGVLVRGRDAPGPDEVALSFIEGVASLAGLGLLARNVPASLGDEQHMRVVLDALFRCQESERERISRELHDEANQSLTSLILGLAVLERQLDAPEAREQTARLRERAVQALDGVRRVAKGLRPPALGELGLGPALRSLCESFAEDTGIRADFYHLDVDCPCRSRFIDLALYRIVQEALTNVARHAEATEVAVVQTCREGLVTVQIEDNGKGCSPRREDPSSATCLGILGMKERAALLGGRVRVESVPGKRTTVYVEIPADFVDEESADARADQSTDS